MYGGMAFSGGFSPDGNVPTGEIYGGMYGGTTAIYGGANVMYGGGMRVAGGYSPDGNMPAEPQH
jgi:hypothetical protein